MTATAALVAAVTVLLSTRTFVSVERARFKLIQVATAPREGKVRIATSDLEPFAALRQPAALILRIANTATETVHVVVTVDDTTACDSTIAAHATRRIDCRVDYRARAPAAHAIAIAGPETGWHVEYVEIATHHGNTSGLGYLVILPHGSTHYNAPSAISIAFYCLAILGLRFLPSPPLSARTRLIHRFMAGTVSLLLAIVLIAPWLSPYKIVISIGTLTGWLAVPHFPRLLTAWRWLTEVDDHTHARWSAATRATIVGLIVLAVFGTLVHVELRDEYGWNYSGFLSLSEGRFDANPLVRDRADVRESLILRSNEGYDGQFAYFVSFDPFMRAYRDDPSQYRSVVDAVPYRYGRIGFSLLVRVLAGSNWRRYPAIMMWLVLGALFLSAFLLALLAQIHELPLATGLLILIVPGFWQSLQGGLAEPIAAATILGGCYFVWQQRWILGAACFALSLLIRETGVIVIGCLAVGAFLAGSRRQALVFLAISVAPLLLWRLYVGWILFPDWGWKGFLDSPSDFGWPLKGFIDLWRLIAAGEYYRSTTSVARAGWSYPLLLVASLALAGMLVRNTPTAVNVAALIYSTMAICLNYQMIWVHVGNGQRGTYEVFVTLALSLLGFKLYPRSLRVATVGFWCAAAAYVIFGAFDAEYLRAALGIPI